jgi:hypothetical protein
MRSTCIAAAVVAVLTIAALGTKIGIDHQELRALRRSHEVRVRFCRGYRGSIAWTHDTFAASQPVEVRRLAWHAYHLLAGGGGGAYYELCHVDPKQLEPEASDVTFGCNLDPPNPDYSCYERAAAKLWRSIPDDFDP